MANLRAKIRWTVPGAGTAYSVLHFGMKHAEPATNDDATEIMNKLASWVQDLRPYLPNQVSLQIMNDVEVITPATNELIGVVTGTAQSLAVGQASSTAPWSAPVGAVVTWGTGTILRGRRIRGRTFIVPLSSTAFDTDGTLNSTTLTGIGQAANALRQPGTLTELVVYARPTAPGASDGSGGVVTSHRIPDMGAVLRSRRS